MKNYISKKEINKNYENALTASEKKALDYQYDILKIATVGTGKKRISLNTFEKAKKVYHKYKLLNKYNDLILIYESDEYKYKNYQEYIKYLNKKSEKLENQLKKMIKPFNLKIKYFSWIASIVDIKGSQIGLFYCK